MGLLDALRGNAGEIDAGTVQEEFQPLLADGERVEKAFSLVRDQIIFTNKRLIFIDKQGLSGKKQRWLSIPYSKITRFSAESAGFMDYDAELDIWVGSAEQPLRITLAKGVPIQDVYRILSTHML